jgi:hypothetical protein
MIQYSGMPVTNHGLPGVLDARFRGHDGWEESL